jgi:hypothetical protein
VARLDQGWLDWTFPGSIEEAGRPETGETRYEIAKRKESFVSRQGTVAHRFFSFKFLFVDFLEVSLP